MDLDYAGPSGRRTEVDWMVPVSVHWPVCTKTPGICWVETVLWGLETIYPKSVSVAESCWSSYTGAQGVSGLEGWAVLHWEADTAEGQVRGESCARAWAQVWDTLVGCSITHCMSSPAHSQRHWPLYHNVLPRSSPVPLFSLLGLGLAPTHWGNAQSIPQDACAEKDLLLGCSSYEILLS